MSDDHAYELAIEASDILSLRNEIMTMLPKLVTAETSETALLLGLACALNLLIDSFESAPMRAAVRGRILGVIAHGVTGGPRGPRLPDAGAAR